MKGGDIMDPVITRIVVEAAAALLRETKERFL